MATGSAAEAAVEAAIGPKVVLYKRVADAAAVTATILEANRLIAAVAAVRGAPAGSRCHFELETAEDRVTLTVAGDEFYIQQAVALSRRTGWKRDVRIVEMVQIRPIVRRAEEPEPAVAAADPRQNLYRGLRNTRRATHTPRVGRLTQLASQPQWQWAPLREVARAYSAVTVPQRTGRPLRTNFNALQMAREAAREVRGAANSSSSTE